MAEHGFAEPAEGGSYRPGPRLLGLAAAALSDSRVLELTRPVLADLRLRTGHVAFYAARHGSDAVYLELSEPAREYRMSTRPGHRSPLHACGVGLAILSVMPAGESAAVVDAPDLEARTHNTLTDPAALRAELAQAALRGYAVDDEYDEPDVRSVAAPCWTPRAGPWARSASPDCPSPSTPAVWRCSAPWCGPPRARCPPGSAPAPRTRRRGLDDRR